MRVSREHREGDEFLRLNGELDAATLPALERWLQVVEGAGSSRIVLDLGHITFIDTCGPHAFMRAAERAGRSGRSFAIVDPSAVVRRILQITGTAHLMEADQDLSDAPATRPMIDAT